MYKNSKKQAKSITKRPKAIEKLSKAIHFAIHLSLIEAMSDLNSEFNVFSFRVNSFLLLCPISEINSERKRACF